MPILQSGLPCTVKDLQAARKLPGTSLLRDQWLCQDDAFAGQMALRDSLIEERADDVIAALPETNEPLAELLSTVTSKVGAEGGYDRLDGSLRRPDGVTVAIDAIAPLRTLGRLVAEDLCLLQSNGTEHVLTAAVLCFPASWTLSEKIGKPLSALHGPVPDYDSALAQRTQRMFDHLKPGQPLMRRNVLFYDDPCLFQPRSESAPRDPVTANGRYLRSERQCLMRLPKTGAIVFSIHTSVVDTSQLPPEVADEVGHLRTD